MTGHCEIGRNIDDAPCALLLHPRHHRLGKKDCAFDMGVEHAIDIGLRYRLDRLRKAADAGVVDKNVNTARLPLQSLAGFSNVAHDSIIHFQLEQPAVGA